MKPKQIKEFKALTTSQDRARFLLNLGITASVAIVRAEGDLNHAECKWVACAGGARLPGAFESQREALHSSVDFLMDELDEKEEAK